MLADISATTGHQNDLDVEAKIAVLIPCHNEALSIADTVRRFRQALPSAVIYVYDNCSSDNTADIAERAGAVIRFEPVPGKGNVVRRMFADIDADVYVMADGDNTYEAESAPIMVAKLLSENLDMVIGVRRNIRGNAHRTGHASGNRVFNSLYSRLFGSGFTDIFSGYRVFSYRFAKSFPAISRGFEIETEMSVHASQLRMPVMEVETHYAPRTQGSLSKLRTFRDGTRILSAMMIFFKEVKPLLFFGAISFVLGSLALVLAWPLIVTWQATGLVPRLPTAVLVSGLMSLSAMSMGCGLILDSVARGRLEQKRFNYLSLPKRHPPNYCTNRGGT